MSLRVLFFICICIATDVRADNIWLRGSNNPIECKVLSGGVDGLHVELPHESSTSLFPWSSIAEITTDIPRPALKKYVQQGEKIWRSKVRFLRGDLKLSEPSFALLFRELTGTSGEDSRVVSEGLLRCYVASGNLRDALHPWLETVRLEELGVASPYPDLLPVLDPSTMLCSHLPPLWPLDSYTVPLLEKYKNSKLKTTSSIAKLLLMQNTNETLLPIEGVDDPDFLVQIIGSARGVSQLQSTLLTPQKEMLPWKDAWSNYFHAISLLQNNSEETRVNALLLLSKVSAQNQTAVPWLSGAAMLRLADELERDELTEEAHRIRIEARSLFPTHPLLHKGIPK